LKHLRSKIKLDLLFCTSFLFKKFILNQQISLKINYMNGKRGRALESLGDFQSKSSGRNCCKRKEKEKNTFLSFHCRPINWESLKANCFVADSHFGDEERKTLSRFERIFIDSDGQCKKTLHKHFRSFCVIFKYFEIEIMKYQFNFLFT